jgi:hypothetical protein
VSLKLIENAKRSEGRRKYSHFPDRTLEELEWLHKLWLDLSQWLDDKKLHHGDLVYLALKELEPELREGDREVMIRRLRRYVSKNDNHQMSDGGVSRPRV